MKKNFKRTLAKVMAVALTVSMLGVSANDADAAKKIKLSSKSISVVKGKTKKVTIKNVKAKKVKKLTVKSANKKIATVKKAGKTAIKVTGKKAGKSTKVTVKVKVGKKTTKLTLKVKVTKAKKKAKKVVVTAAPATVAPATAAPAASASAAPAASASTKPATTPAATPAATPDEATPAPTAPAQPEKPSTPAKQMPELNLREEAATEWTLGGEFGTAIFNTDDTISYSSYAWAKKTGDCYNNGIAWYIDPAKKGKVDLSAYTDLELTIKTDAEIKFMTWGGSADAASFWDKNDSWGAASKTVENADGSKTITYNLEKIFGSATKVKKAVAVGLTLKSDKDGNAEEFSERTATIYGIKFVNNGGAGTDTNNTDTNNVDTNNVDTNNVDTNNVDTNNVDTNKTETGNDKIKDAVTVSNWKFPGVASFAWGDQVDIGKDLTDVKSIKVTYDVKGDNHFFLSLSGNSNKYSDIICTNQSKTSETKEYTLDLSKLDASKLKDEEGLFLVLKVCNDYTMKDLPTTVTIKSVVLEAKEGKTVTQPSVDEKGVMLSGAAQYTEAGVITIAKGTLTATSKIDVEYTVKNPENTKMQFKTASNVKGKEANDYLQMGDTPGKSTIDLSTLEAEKFSADSNFKIMFQTIEAGFTGSVTIDKVFIDGKEAELEVE